MTFEEKQEFKILSLLKGRKERMLTGEIENILNTEMGGGIRTILHDLTERGFIDKADYVIEGGGTNPGYIINKIGEKKFISLKNKKINRIVAGIIVWGTFFAAIISAFGVFYTTCNDNRRYSTIESQDTLMKKKEQPTLIQPQTTKPDSTSGYPKSLDSLPN
jgi:hypothetical protein